MLVYEQVIYLGNKRSECFLSHMLVLCSKRRDAFMSLMFLISKMIYATITQKFSGECENASRLHQM